MESVSPGVGGGQWCQTHLRGIARDVLETRREVGLKDVYFSLREAELWRILQEVGEITLQMCGSKYDLGWQEGPLLHCVMTGGLVWVRESKARDKPWCKLNSKFNLKTSVFGEQCQET